MANNNKINISLKKKIDYLTWHMHHNLSYKQQERWLKGVFYNLVGYMPDFKNPKTFNEKLCWYRLNYSHPDIPRIVDKIAFKDYICEILGCGYTAELHGFWEDEADILWNNLPEQFLFKSSLSSSANNILFVKNKDTLDKDKTLYELSEWLQPWNSSSKSFTNWEKGLEPRILAEEYLIPEGGDLVDYKFLCFNGEPSFLFVVTERKTIKYCNFYDLDWKLLPFERAGRNTPYKIYRPRQFDKMISIAMKLSKPFPYVRVDFYDVNGRLLIGELTFSHGGGLKPFNPVKWDLMLGEKFHLPK